MKSERAKHMRIIIKSDASVVVVMPRTLSEKKAHNFIEEKKEWILKNQQKMKKRCGQNNEREKMTPKGTKKEFEEYKDQALSLVSARLEYFNKKYAYTWRDITIKNVSTRWGSCSKVGNLNFSYKVVLLPLHLADYIIVHELCHLGAFNHSQQFWNLVGRVIPEYKIFRKELRGVI